MKVEPILLAVTIASGLCTSACPQSYSVLYNFPNGETPGASELLLEGKGTLIGPQSGYPNEYDGALFQVVDKRGAWREQTLHTFTGQDGANPQGGLVRDANGVYYGTAPNQGMYSCGNIYSLTRSNGIWTVSTLYNFTGADDGCHPTGTLLLNPTTGTLYGTASTGGPAYGNVFALRPHNGQWTLSVLYNFGTDNNFNDGLNPQDGVRFGTNRKTLIGVTPYGGGEETDYGTVFMLTESGGKWNETVLHKFGGSSDGLYPQDVDVDASGNIFGVASKGGANAEGTAFELSKGAFKVLHDFGTSSDGYSPVGLRIERSTGNIFGVTSYGGETGGGTIFELSAGNWTESVLYDFLNGDDGYHPLARPSEDEKTGNLYGTAASGGTNGGGTVWMLSPSPRRSSHGLSLSRAVGLGSRFPVNP